MRTPLLSAALAVSFLAACADPRSFPAPGDLVQSKAQRITSAAPDADVQAAVDANTNLALEVARRSPMSANYAVSSYSITSALSMALAGAKGNTAEGIRTALSIKLDTPAHHRALNTLDAALQSRGVGAKGKDDGPYRFVVSNQLFAQKGLNVTSDYLDTLAQEYGAGVRLMDFQGDSEASRVAINEWISRRTETLIPTLFEKGTLSAATRLTIVNTLYFNAAWKKPFKRDQTNDAPFKKSDGSTSSIPTMHGEVAASAKEIDGTTVLELPYDGEETSLVVIAPPAGNLESFERGLTAQSLSSLIGGTSSRTWSVVLPKFEVRARTELSQVLKELGMTAAFTESDFSGITGANDLSLDQVIHEAVVKTDEEGTEAAAATGLGFRTVSAPQSIVIDRPFVFIIRDVKTGMVLFYGRFVG